MKYIILLVILITYSSASAQNLLFTNKANKNVILAGRSVGGSGHRTFVENQRLADFVISVGGVEVSK